MSVARAQLVIFTSQLASMLRSRLPLVDALEHLASDTPDKKLKTAVGKVIGEVKLGVDFADALSSQPRVFGPIYTSIIRAGMESGRLGKAATNVSEYLSQVGRINAKLRNALVYPIVLMVGLFLMLNAMIFFILPRFERMFAQFSKGLPWPTELMLAFGDLYTNHLIEIGVVGAGVWILGMFTLQSKAGRQVWDRHKLKIPVMGEVWRLAALAQFTRTLALQVDSSVPIATALKLSAPAAGNVYFTHTIEVIIRDIEMGSGLADAFRRHGLFSGVVQQMAAVGEQTGELNEMLDSVATYYDSLWLQKIDTAVSVVNPLMTGIVGMLIAGMMIAAFLPVFDLAGASLI